VSGARGSWPGLRRAFRLPGNRERMRHEVNEELRFHVEGRIEELMARGMTREEAEAEARVRFGDVTRIRAECERVDAAARRQLAWRERLHAWGRDARYALRGMATRPVYTATVVLTLALAIGANTAIYSVVDSVLLRPLPVRGLDELVVIRDDLLGLGLHDMDVSPGEALDLMERRDLFQAVTAFSTRNLNLTGSGEPQRIAAAATLGEFFGVFGVRPHIGNLYRPENSENGNHDVVVLSYAFWRDVAGADPRIVGTTIRLNDRAYKVVGVASPEFRYPRTAQLWMPSQITPKMRGAGGRFSQYLTAVARVRPGITLEQLRGQLAAEAERWHERFGARAYNPAHQHRMLAVPFVDFLSGQLRPILLVLTGAVAFVLLIACANVASLQLVRAAGRAKELAVRAALGAGRWPIVRQLLVENLVLALAGGLAGLAVGYLAIRLIARSDAAQFAMLRDVQLDTPVLAFTVVVTLLAALLFGTVPAFRAGRVNVTEVIKESAGRGTSAGVARGRFLQGAVVVQVALALVLLVGSGLVLRSLSRLLESDPGFRAENVLTMQLALPSARYQDAAATLAFHDALVERLRALPGVQGVGTAYGLPFSELDNSSPFRIEGRPVSPGDPERHANMWFVGGDYFRTMGIPLRKGRVFTDADAEGTQVVSIIDEALARQFFPNEDPIGKQISQGLASTIVGVVGSVKKSDLAAPDKATIYYSYRQQPWAVDNMAVTVRTTLPTSDAARMLRSAVREQDRSLPVFDVLAMEERVTRSLGARRLAATVLSGFTALSLLLALLGVYGVLSYSTTQRTHEIGIRMALGAKPGDVVAMVLRSGVMLAGAGLAIGTLAFVSLGRVLSSLLYGISPRDPATLTGSIVLLAAVALLASYLPARRAARVDPVEALRAE